MPVLDAPLVTTLLAWPASTGPSLPSAVAQGRYTAALEPHIVGHCGLDHVQEALDVQRKGVSASKVVVIL